MKLSKEATLEEICEGLRAQVKGLVPVKPAVPSGENVVRLPCATKEHMIRQEAGNWQRRMVRREMAVNLLPDGTTWPERVAAAELSAGTNLFDCRDAAKACDGRQKFVVTEGVLESIPAQMPQDEVSVWPEAAEEELLDFLRLHLTATELRALQDRSNGWKVKSRKTLMRARQKAVKALAESALCS